MDLGVAIVEEQDLVVGLTLGSHDGSTNLAQADTMAPAFTIQDKYIIVFNDIESRA